MPQRRRSRRFTGGQGLTEFALILPILLFAVMGIVDFGRVMLAYATLSNSLREAVRYAELYGDTDPRPYLQCDVIRGLAERNIFASTVDVNIEHVTIDGNGEAATTYTNCSGATDDNIDTGDLMVITTTGSVRFITPLLSNAMPSFNFSFRAQRTIAKNLMLAGDSDDDDEGGGSEPAINFVEEDRTVAENVGTITYTVRLTATSTQTVTVQFSTANGTAVAPGDYTSASQTLTFTAGQTEKTVTVTIANDSTDENDETFTVNLASATNATIDEGQRTVTVTDNDGDPSVSISNTGLTIAENAGSGTFTVTLSAASGKTVTAQFSTANGTAAAGSDYTSVSNQTVTFNAGETTRTVNVTISNDTTDENDETFTVSIASPSNATLGTATRTATITDEDNAPSLTMSANATFPESAANATLTLTLSPASGKPVTVQYSTANGTATGGSDFTAATNQTITFNAGETSKTISVAITNDTTAESDETFNVTLANGTNVTLVDTQRSITIQDNDNTTPQLRINDVTVSESGTNATFTLTLSPTRTSSTAVRYTTSNGTATAGSDYTAASNVLVTINANTATKTFTIPIASDTLDEADETFNVTITTTASGVTVADNLGVGLITDDDSPPALSINDVTVTEGTASATFTVTLAPASGQTVTVDYSTTGGSATTADLTSVSGTLTFNAGETTKTINVPITNDSFYESNETFFIGLANATNATLSDSQGQGTITDNDTAPSLTINDVTVSEAAGNASFTVTLSPSSGQTVTVQYATANGTAVVTDDYTAASGTLTFLAGETSKPVTVPIINDTRDESDETFVVSLSAVTNAAITDAQGQGTITDNDPTPTLSIDDVNVNEASGNAIFTVTLSAASNLAVGVQYATANGTATSTGDYTATSGTLSFSAGEVSKTITVPITNDAVVESAKTFVVNLSAATNATIADTQGQGTITDDDTAPVTGSLKPQIRYGSTGANEITPYTRIANTGSAAVPLSELSVRYYFTRDTAQPLFYDCYWAQVGCGNITFTFVALSPAKTGADYYLQLTFSAAAGSVSANNNSGEIQFRIRKGDWSNFNQSDDYSYLSGATSYTDAPKMTVYRNGSLVWGTAP